MIRSRDFMCNILAPALLSVFSLSIGCSCSSTRHSDGFVKEPLVTNYDTSEQDQPIVSWINTDSVAIGLWGEYNDTVEVFVNHEKILHMLIEDKDNPYSGLDFAGKTVWITDNTRIKIVEIKLLRKRRKISFSLDRNYPLCNVKHMNGSWTASYRSRYKSTNVLRSYR